jgi:hypothetical protein
MGVLRSSTNYATARGTHNSLSFFITSSRFPVLKHLSVLLRLFLTSLPLFCFGSLLPLGLLTSCAGSGQYYRTFAHQVRYTERFNPAAIERLLC